MIKPLGVNIPTEFFEGITISKVDATTIQVAILSELHNAQYKQRTKLNISEVLRAMRRVKIQPGSFMESFETSFTFQDYVIHVYTDYDKLNCVISRADDDNSSNLPK